MTDDLAGLCWERIPTLEPLPVIEAATPLDNEERLRRLELWRVEVQRWTSQVEAEFASFGRWSRDVEAWADRTESR